MKAILFQSFLDLVEAQYGADTLDAILADVDAPSGGIYTASGDYPHIELIELIVALSKRTHLSASNLTKSFGMYHFAEFIAAYPQLSLISTLRSNYWKRLIVLYIKKCKRCTLGQNRQNLNLVEKAKTPSS